MTSPECMVRLRLGELSLLMGRTVLAGLEGKEGRLGLCALKTGPVGRFDPIAPWYRPEVGIGRNVGVHGRDTGVGIELVVLVVAFVLMLLRPSESRDWGRLMPVGI